MKKNIQVIISIFVMSTALFALSWEQMFPELDSYVSDITQGNVSGVGNYGYMFSTSRPNYFGPSGGLAYYDFTGELHTRTTGNLPLVSVASYDNGNDEIYCPIGMGSDSDGFYIYKTSTDSFYFEYHAYTPKFLKRLSSGMYYSDSQGLKYSNTSIPLNIIDGFESMLVTDVEETSDGKLFVGREFVEGGGMLYMKTADSISWCPTALNIKDIYLRSYPNNNEVIFTQSNGTSRSDGLYRILYNDSTITGIEPIAYIQDANLITEYTDSYIVTTTDSAYVYIVPIEGGGPRIHDHGLDINNIYCISEQYPIYTPNFLIGTDKGVFMCTGSTGIQNGELEIKNYTLYQNYPNPFNPTTEISFSLKEKSNINLSVFNSKGELIRTLFEGKKNKGMHIIDFNASQFNSGIYFYKLTTDEKTETRKMLLLK